MTGVGEDLVAALGVGVDVGTVVGVEGGKVDAVDLALFGGVLFELDAVFFQVF